jgi:hypothetical protein
MLDVSLLAEDLQRGRGGDIGRMIICEISLQEVNEKARREIVRRGDAPRRSSALKAAS